MDQILHFISLNPLVAVIIAIALIFDYTNWRNDSANSIATIVTTRVLTPKQAVVWAASFNFLAYFLFGTEIAKTIGTGLVNTSMITPAVIGSGLIGAILWNTIAHHTGTPSSSSHALLGGLLGATLAFAWPKGVIEFPFSSSWFHAIELHGFLHTLMTGWSKIFLFLILWPLLGAVFGWIVLVATSWIASGFKPQSVQKSLKYIRLFSSAAYSLGHWGNDAQKTMGILLSLLIAWGAVSAGTTTPPEWVVLTCYTVIALGTVSWGWKIIRTMGNRIIKIHSIDGFSAEVASASSIFLGTHFGAPVSTGQVITGAIAWVGATKNMRRVHWKVILHIITAWIITIPVSASVWYIIFMVLGKLLT